MTVSLIKRSRGFYARSKVPDIVALLHQGFSYREIANKIGCTTAYVCAVKVKHISGPVRFAVAGLHPEHLIVLRSMAISSGVTTAEIARSLLIDSINDEIDKNNAARSHKS